MLQLYLRDLNKDGEIARKWATHKEGNVPDPALVSGVADRAFNFSRFPLQANTLICLYTDDDYVVTCPRGELSSVWRKSALMSNWVALPPYLLLLLFGSATHRMFCSVLHPIVPYAPGLPSPSSLMMRIS